MAKKSKKTAVKKTSAKVKSKAAPAKGKVATKVKAKAVKASAKKTVGKASVSPSKKVTSVASDRVIEYKLFTEDSVRNLEDQVNYHIKKGWAPVGGVVLHGSSTFTQTMVRHEG